MTQPTTPFATPLASPDERPDASIVVYDGECRFCSSQVAKLARWDKRGRLAFLSLHDPEVARRWPDLTHEQMMEQMYLVTPQNQKYAGAAAIRFLASELPRLRLLGWLMNIPGSMPLWNRLYAAFARRRYWFGKNNSCANGACKIPPRER